jgi:hypothetical protein
MVPLLLVTDIQQTWKSQKALSALESSNPLPKKKGRYTISYFKNNIWNFYNQEYKNHGHII